MFQNPTESQTIPSTSDFEPDEQWKSRLKVEIENNLRPMVNEAKQNLQETWKKVPVSAIEHERTTEGHIATMKKIRDQVADQQFQIALERERQERRWVASQKLDQERPESMIKAEQGVLDTMERERVVRPVFPSQSTAGTSGSRASGRPVEHAIRVLQEPMEAPDTNKVHARFTSDGTRPREPLPTKPSPAIDGPKDMPRFVRPATNTAKSTRRRNLRRQTSLSTAQIPEFWIPSITPEEDAQISRAFRGSTASTISSHRTSPVLNIPLSTEPHGLIKGERHRISAAEQESNIDRTRAGENATSYTNADTRASVPSTTQRLEAPFSPPSVSHSPSSTIPVRHSRSSGDSHPRAPLLFPSRPIATKRSSTSEDGGFQSSPSPTKGWNGPLHAPQMPDGDSVPRSWQLSNLPTRLFSQDMLHGNSPADGGYYHRSIHMLNEAYGVYEEDLDDADWREYGERMNRQREDNFRRIEEEVRREERRELELRHKEQEALRREAQLEALKIRRQKEEEGERRRKEDEVEIIRRQEARKHTEDFSRQKLTKWLDEEARRVEQDILHNSEEVKRKEDEDRRTEDEIRPKEEEEDAQHEEREVRRKSSQELSTVASDPLQDLTDQLRGRSNYPIASGGFGDIWKCDLVKLNEIVQVAVKTIRTFELDDDASMRKNSRRVRRELKVWGRLKHDCILPLWGVANDFGPYPAMICPWIDNGTLTGFLERRQDTLSSEDKFALLNDIALGLQYLHRKSIVHGDLTGSNVLVGGNGRACLADFGLSTMMLEFTGPSYLTSSIRGNIRWAAAELFEVPEDDEIEAAVSLSTECDIYPFGSIILQVMTCKVPYYNVKKDHVVLSQVIRGKKPEPPKESPIAPLHWEFIQRCWLPRASRPLVGEIVEFVACEDNL